MLAAEESARFFEPVTDNADAAMRASRRQRVDRAFEAVEDMGPTVVHYLKSLVVVVPSGFADCHNTTPPS